MHILGSPSGAPNHCAKQADTGGWLLPSGHLYHQMIPANRPSAEIVTLKLLFPHGLLKSTLLLAEVIQMKSIVGNRVIKNKK